MDFALISKRLLESGLKEREAVEVLKVLTGLVSDRNSDPQEAWRRLSKEILSPDHPFAVHKLLSDFVFASWDAAKGPIPLWSPTKLGIQDTNLAKFMASFEGPPEWKQGRTGDPCTDFPLLLKISWENPEAFWPPVLQELRISFREGYHRILQNDSNPDVARWLPGARLNIAECALCCRDPDAAALLWAEEGAPEVLRRVTLRTLRASSFRVAAALRAAGFRPGDAIAIDMPMTAVSVEIYFGIVLCGCAVISVADSFAAPEIATRLQIGRAAAIFTQDVIVRGGKSHALYSRVTDAGAPTAIVLPSSPGQPLQVPLRAGDMSWDSFLGAADGCPDPEAHIADAYETTNILFSSGTTGEPKAIPWSHVTPIKCASDAFFHQDVRRGDVLAWPTNLGWMMGPWLLYAALLNGAAIALYQGSPLGREFGVFVEAARVNVLGVVPSIVKAWRASNCMQGLDWSGIRCFSSTGEASAPEDYHWLMARARYSPVIEYCGGTEIGGAFLSGCMLQPQSPSRFSTPTLGTHLVLIKPDGSQSLHGSSEACVGEVALIPPLLGTSQRLLNKDHYPIYYGEMPRLLGGGVVLRRHGDEMERLPGGFYTALGRSDDTMNLGGIKVSSVELERVCVSGVSEVLEAAAVGVPTPGGGPDQLVLFLVLTPAAATAATAPGRLLSACQSAIRSTLNPLFKVERVVVRELLPRTASNKVMRRVLRDELRRPPAARL